MNNDMLLNLFKDKYMLNRIIVKMMKWPKSIIVGICVVLVAFSILGWAASREHDVKQVSPVIAEQIQKSTIEVEVVKLTASGFVPSELSRRSGQFYLVVQNNLGNSLPTMNFYSLLAPQVPLKSLQSPLGQMFREEYFEIGSGKYLLNIPSRSSAQLAITIGGEK